MFKIETSKSGHSFAIHNGVRLHSAYDPQREARKFVVSQIQDRTPRTALIVGPGLGYIGAELRRRGIFTIDIFLSPLTYSAAVEHGNLAWKPQSAPNTSSTSTREQQPAVSLRTFLRSLLSDTDTVGLEVLSWSPCLEAFPAEAEKALEAIADVVRESNANLTTTAAFGQRWFRNLCENFYDLRTIRGSQAACEQVVLVAAGPSLESAIPALQELYQTPHSGTEIWAVGTALRPLLAAGVTPDIVITTDAGYFALEHLNAERASPTYCIAAPLTATRGVTRRGAALLVLDQGSILERDLYANCRLPSIKLPANGTVAGTALELSLRMCSGKVILVGLDLGYRDIQPHARPHSFEHYLWRQESRLRPLYGAYATRAFEHSTRIANGRRTTRQLVTYAGWFRRRLSHLQDRVATLEESAIDLNLSQLSRNELMESAKGVSDTSQANLLSTAAVCVGDSFAESLTATARIDALKALFRTIELRMHRVSAIPNQEEFFHLLNPQRSTPKQTVSGSSPDDLQALIYLNCRGVLNCGRAADTTAFRAELTHTVESVQDLLHGPIQEYLQ